MGLIGIRREDKNRWERRVPLTPDHVAELVRGHQLRCVVQPSPTRAFADIDYAAAGATLAEDLSACDVILGVKEIPPEKLLAGKTHVYFSHVVKGQPASMPMLRRVIELGATLLDYELIVTTRGRRLVAFGRYAGHAGMLDSLWALGQRLAWEGHVSPLAEIRPALQYDGLAAAMAHLASVGEDIRHRGLPVGLRPVVVGFTGSGNVALGAQEVFDTLPFELIEVEDLLTLGEDRDRARNVLYKVLLPTDTTVRRRDGGAFDRADYRAHPDRYESAMAPLLQHVTLLVNGIYWQPGRPRLVTRAMLAALWAAEEQPKLRVIGDISCDVEGSIEATVHVTTPGDPVYVYDAEQATTTPGFEGRGTVILAVDNLPCELPIESSEHFGDALLRFVPPLARCDWSKPATALELPAALRNAIVVHKGELRDKFSYLREPLARFGGGPSPS